MKVLNRHVHAKTAHFTLESSTFRVT